MFWLVSIIPRISTKVDAHLMRQTVFSDATDAAVSSDVADVVSLNVLLKLFP